MPARPARTALVTGASTGIGRATALRLDREGYRVFAGIRTDEDAERLRAEASARLRPLHLDVTDGGQVVQAAETIRDASGAEGLAALVNNAGISIAGPLEMLGLDEFRHQLEVNVVGQLAVTQALLPYVRRARGRIVFTGSVAGLTVFPFVGAYSVSKFGLEALADALRIELRATGAGVHVAVVQPGLIKTPIWTKGERETLARFDLSSGVARMYAPHLRRLEPIVRHAAAEGTPPEAVAEVIFEALTARRPRSRYLVGEGARLRAWLRFLPDRLRDTLLLRLLHAGPPPIP